MCTRSARSFPWDVSDLAVAVPVVVSEVFLKVKTLPSLPFCHVYPAWKLPFIRQTQFVSCHLQETSPSPWVTCAVCVSVLGPLRSVILNRRCACV